MALSRAHVANRKKRAINYAVEGCFSEFPGVGESKAMGGDNSNVKCQETCKDQGYILAATRGDQCHCGNIYRKGKKVNDVNASTNASHGRQPAMNHKAAVVDQVRILRALLATLMSRNKYFVD